MLILGVLVFPLIITGVVLNTIFLVREIRRNEQHDAFINAVTHELKTPVASIRLYLQTLQSREHRRRQAAGVLPGDGRGHRSAAGHHRAGPARGPRRRQDPPREPRAGRPLRHRAGLSRARAHASSPAGRRADLSRVARQRVGAAGARRRGRAEGRRLEPGGQRHQVLGRAGAGGRGARAAREQRRPRCACAIEGVGISAGRAQAHLQALLPDSRRGRDSRQGHRPGAVHRPIGDRAPRRQGLRRERGPRPRQHVHGAAAAAAAAQ